MAVADCSGNLLTINSYDEYGIPDDASTAALSTKGRFRYTGQALIPELGMYYYKARIYSANSCARALLLLFRQPPRIHKIHRIIPDIGVDVHPVAIADGVALDEPSEAGRVHAGLIVIQTRLGHKYLAGIAEPLRQCGARHTILVIGVDIAVVAADIRTHHHRAEPVAIEQPQIGERGGRTRIHRHRIIARSCAMDIAIEQRATVVGKAGVAEQIAGEG